MEVRSLPRTRLGARQPSAAGHAGVVEHAVLEASYIPALRTSEDGQAQQVRGETVDGLKYHAERMEERIANVERIEHLPPDRLPR
jgi:hypothetical protein